MIFKQTDLRKKEKLNHMNTTRQNWETIKVFIKRNIEVLQKEQNLVMNSDHQAKSYHSNINFWANGHQQKTAKKKKKIIFTTKTITLSKWLIKQNRKTREKEVFL